MKVVDVRKMKHPLDRLLYWIRERESIRRKKDLGLPRPWTDDEILDTYRFCNVRRMDDRVSKWLLTNWYEPYQDHPNMLLAVSLARQLNNPDALAAVGFPEKWNPSEVLAVLEERAAIGSGNYSAAYMITSNYGTRGRAPESKPYQTVRRVCDPIAKSGYEPDTESMENTWRRLQEFQGFSSFIAGQVVADLRWALTGRWVDRNRWAPMGPGSTRGANRFNGESKDGKLSEKEFLTVIRKLRSFYQERLSSEISSRLEAHDIQSTLCEFDKYERVLWGEGRPKQLYRG